MFGFQPGYTGSGMDSSHETFVLFHLFETFVLNVLILIYCCRGITTNYLLNFIYLDLISFYFSDNFWEIWYRMEIFPNQAMDIFFWNGFHSPTAFQHYANSKGRLSFIWLQQKNWAWQTQRTWGGWETVSRRDEVYH